MEDHIETENQKFGAFIEKLSTHQKPIVFATWNINQAKREEAVEETRFDKRWPEIKRLIKECDADILCLQELRNLETSEVDVPRILYEIAQIGYDYKHAYYGPGKFSFGLATFYKRDKFFLFNSRIVQLPATDRIVLDLSLRRIGDAREFHVCNTHFGIDEEEKTLCVDFLGKYLTEIRPGSYLCAGDYNFFDDLGGKEQRFRMLRTAGRDIAWPLANASGTFMGFAHDEHKKPYEAMSRLDHVFVHDILNEHRPCAYGDMEKVKNRDYPSDHLMIRLGFGLPDQHFCCDK